MTPAEPSAANLRLSPTLPRLRKYAAAYAVAIGGLLLTCLSSWNVRNDLQASYLKEFDWAARDRVESLRTVADQGLDALREIRGLFYAAEEINANEFRVFTESIVQRRPYIETLLWAPLSSSREAAPKPASSPAKGNAAGAAAATGDNRRGVRIAVELLSSPAPAALVTGVKLNASADLAPLFERATASGAIAVSGRLPLATPGQATRYVIYAVLPVYARGGKPGARSRDIGDNRMPPRGFVVGVYSIDKLVHTAISLLEPRGVEVLVRDESAGNAPQFLHFYASRLEPESTATDAGLLPERDQKQPRLAASIAVGDRSWSVICVATHAFRSAEAFSRAHWLVFLSGLGFTSLLSLYLVRSRREMDQQLRLTQTIFEREELFRQLAETVDVVFWASTADATRLEYIGPTFGQIAGTQSEPTGASLALMLDVFAPDERRTLVAAIGELQSTGHHFNVVLPVSRADGERRWLRICGFPVRDAERDGKRALLRIVGFCEDITEHKRADDALRDSEAKLRTLFKHSPDLILTVDGQANIVFTNRQLPYPVGGGAEKRSQLLLPEEARGNYLAKLAQVFSGGRVEHFRYTSGDATWREIRMVPISSADSPLPVMVAMVVITDITENRKLQRQAIRNARLASLGVLSAGIAHEISNPNHAIMANAGLLARIWQDALVILSEYENEQGDFLLGGLSFKQVRQTVLRGMTDIGDNAQRIQKIVANLKHLGKQDQGRMDETADLGKILRAVVGLLDAQIRKHTDAFALHLPAALPALKGNVQQLEQVFINVIVNALEALPNRSRSVKVSASTLPDEQRLLVCVEDQGDGIADAVATQIGEPFFTTKAERGGTGLGLSISSLIIEKHGGSLKLASNASAGTTVSIELPVDRDKKDASEA